MKLSELKNLTEFRVLNEGKTDKCLWINDGVHYDYLSKDLIKKLIVMLSNTLEHYELIQNHAIELNDIRNINEWLKIHYPEDVGL